MITIRRLQEELRSMNARKVELLNFVQSEINFVESSTKQNVGR
jgi:hypothetical protein